MPQNKNITIYHTIAETLPFCVNFFILLGAKSSRIKISHKAGLTCLYLHSVEKKYLIKFERLVKDLMKNFIFMRTENIEEIFNGPGTNSQYLHMSFDDGFKNNLDIASLLKGLDIPATFFVVTEFINGNREILSPEFLQYAQKKEALSWADINELFNEGFEIGSHSACHTRFSELTEENAHKELSQSKNEIEDHIGSGIASFSFPFGRKTDFNQIHVNQARKCGYKYLFSTELQRYTYPISINPRKSCLGRYGIEPYLNKKSVLFLINGLMEYFR
jgi:peptidoglycan/xylan/chitin deacetylase (PgdA/CDA1 family)